MSKKIVISALIIPIIALAMLVVYKIYVLSVGQEVILSITGYDPRDLLSGHYLAYEINYDVENICPQRKHFPSSQTGYVCLNPKMFTYKWPDRCDVMIKGNCHRSRFEAGIERYYVPEEDAKRLEDLVRSGNADIVLSVLKNGKAQVKDLLINGKSWREQ